MRIVYNKFPFLTLYWNTIVVTVVTIAGQLFIVSLAAYAFARLNFPFKNILFIGMLVLPSLFSVFGVFLLRQAFQTIPKDLDEAARMDGCSYFRIYWQIMLPLVTPNLVALGIMTMLSTWKNLMWPIIVNRSIEKMTLSAGLAMLIGEHTTYYEQVMAGAVISVLPMIIVFMIFQKQFVEGIAKTGVKG